jgi:beta-glucanase (GH16 family)
MYTTMKKTAYALLAFLLSQTFLGCTQDMNLPPRVPAAPVEDRGWTFGTTPIWADEFDYTGAPDPAKWGYDVGGGGWGNQELQYYTESGNASVANGVLTIDARRENFGGRNFTSARLVTKDKGDWLYGRFEIRAKVPPGVGTWPAIWMLPTDNAYGTWPRSGEIDIMEHVGFDEDNIHVTVHTEAFNHMINTQRGASRIVPGATTEFQTYRVDWTPYAVRGFINGEQMFEFTNDGSGFRAWPFDRRFHLILNIAVGGSWGGQRGVDNNAFPARMEIDYVRVFPMLEP